MNNHTSGIIQLRAKSFLGETGREGWEEWPEGQRRQLSPSALPCKAIAVYRVGVSSTRKKMLRGLEHLS